jgi:hypothetical protein
MFAAFASALAVGPFESAAQLVVVAGAVVLLLMLVALGSFGYRSLRGDGIRWPDEDDDDESGVRREGPDDEDDEWKYY